MESNLENSIEMAIKQEVDNTIQEVENPIQEVDNTIQEEVPVETPEILVEPPEIPVETPEVPVENPEVPVDNPKVPVENPIQTEVQITISPVQDEHKTKKTLDQDTLQRINVGVQFMLEMYRVITSSLLILFVPQLCVDHICTTTENLVWETNTYNTALCFNFISMALLVNMYYLELVRENRFIKYLSVNPHVANDKDEVGGRLALLSTTKQNKIVAINNYYKWSSYAALSIYALNVILSAVAVNKYYAGSQTTTTFITYVLFMATKFSSVYTLVSTDQNIFYSAYIKTNVQFNDVDEDCLN